MMVTKEEGMARRDRWADALESGEYKQGRGFLCRDGGYCCLGVACEIFASETGMRRSSCGTSVRWDSLAGVAPTALVLHLGLLNEDGTDLADARTLAALNDSGTPFAEIARLLREHPEDWFTWAQPGD